jgi:hypothetical protein
MNVESLADRALLKCPLCNGAFNVLQPRNLALPRAGRARLRHLSEVVKRSPVALLDQRVIANLRRETIVFVLSVLADEGIEVFANRRSVRGP